MTWWKEGPEDIDEKPKGVDALGTPCLWSFFNIDCEYCRKANQYYKQGDDENGSRYYKKKTPLALAFFSSNHEALEDYNGKLVMIALPVRQVVGEIQKRLKTGDWKGDPADPENGYSIVIVKEKPEGEEYPQYLVGQGKKIPIKREALIEIYKKMDIPNPKQDKGRFLDWIYNKYPNHIIVSGADIPLDAKVGLRIIPWPWWNGSEPVPENEVNSNASPIKILRFHRIGGNDTFYKLKEHSFDLKAAMSEGMDRDGDEDDIPMDEEGGFNFEEV